MSSPRRSFVTVAVACGMVLALSGAATGQNPVAHWEFEEGGGLEASDSAGTSNGTLMNMAGDSTSWVAGKVGSYALQFDGSQGYVDLGNPPALQITGNQTICMWIRPRVLGKRQNPYEKAYGGEGTITVERGGTVKYYYGIAGSDNTPYQELEMTASLPVGAWTHLAIVRDLTAMRLRWYKDGVLTDETDATYASATASTQSAHIGQGYAGSFDGLIDDVRVYDQALDVAAIQALHGTGKLLVVRATASDFDDADDAFGVGDDIYLWFDTLTNKPMDGDTKTSADMATLFTLSGPGSSTWGTTASFDLKWVSDRELRITVNTLGDANVVIGDAITVLTAAGIQDAGETSPVCTDTSPAIEGDWGTGAAVPAAMGAILMEIWEGGSYVSSDAMVRTDMNPSAPSWMDYQTDFDGIPIDDDTKDYYNTRLRGYIHPTETGDHTFYLCSDDNSELWLSYDDDPVNKRIIAEEDSYSDQDFGDPEVSAAIPLVAGMRYYVEVVHQEGNGGDHVRVGWATPTIVFDFTNPIAGTFLSPWVVTPTIASIMADDPGDGDDVYGAGDTITITFSLPTNQGLAATNYSGDDMNAYFALSGGHSWGSDATNACAVSWTDAKTLVITVNNAADATVDIGDIATVMAAAGITDSLAFRSAWTVSGPVIGNWGLASATGLLGHWRLDELTGRTAYDSAGTNHGAIGGDPTMGVAGRHAAAYDFDGVDDWIDIGPVGIAGNVARSICGWARVDHPMPKSYTTIFGFVPNSSTANSHFDIELQYGEVRLHLYGTEWGICSIDNEWHHYAATYDGVDTCKMYLDGQLVRTEQPMDQQTPPQVVPLVTEDIFRIGRRERNYNYFPGPIDDVRVYDTELTASEVQGIYDYGVPDFGPEITSTAPRNAYVGMLYEYMIGAVGMPVPDPATDFSVSGNPAWLTLTGDVLSGTPPAEGTTGDITVTVTTTVGTDSETFQITIHAAPTGLIAWWKLDESSGTTAYDSSGNGHDGDLQGNPVWVTGADGGGLDLGGDYVETSKTATQLGINGGVTRTVTCWSYTRSFNNAALYHCGTRDAAGRTFGLRTLSTDNLWRIQYWSEDYDFTHDSKDKWVHFALVYEGLNTKVYADGNLIVDWNRSVAIDTGDDVTFQIGRYNPGDDNYNGILDDVRLYNIALTQADIQKIVGGMGPVPPSIRSEPPIYHVKVDDTFTYQITTAGNPAPTTGDITIDIPAPTSSWLTESGGDTITGTPTAAYLGLTETITVTVTNGVAPDAVQTFRLFVVSKANSLVAHWRCDDGSGRDVRDSSPYGDDNIGNLDAPWSYAWVDGAVGGGLWMEGWKEFKALDSTSLRVQEFTICAWARFDVLMANTWEWASPEIIEKEQGNRGYVLGNRQYDSVSHWPLNTLSLRIGDGTQRYSCTYAETAVNEWVHVVGRYDGESLRLYRNTTPVAFARTGPVVIGHNTKDLLGGNDGFEGTLDDIRIYAWALDRRDILDIYNLSPDVPVSPPEILTTPPDTAYVGEEYVYEIGLAGKPSPDVEVAGPLWLQFVDDYTLSGTPDAGDIGVVTVTITASNGEVPEFVQEFELVVTTKYPDLVAWWKLDETSGTVVEDSIGDNDGVNNGAAINQAGEIDRAYRFDGSDYVELPTSIVTSDIGSVSLWVNTSYDFTEAGHIFYGTRTSGDGFGDQDELHLHFGDNERLYFRIEGGANDLSVLSPSAHADGQWHHVAATWDRDGTGTVDLYVDGLSVDSATPGTLWTSFTCTGALRLGGPVSSMRYYNGLIDDVRLFADVLTAAEIAGIHNSNVVTIEATDPDAVEDPIPDLGTFTVTRTGDTTDPLTVAIHLGGSAILGTSPPPDDYEFSVTNGSFDDPADPTLLTIAATQASATITVTPLNDTVPEEPDTVIILLVAYDPLADIYTVGTDRYDVVTITDDDKPGPFTVDSPPAPADGATEVDETGIIQLAWEDPADPFGTEPPAESYTVTWANNQRFLNATTVEDITDLFYDIPDGTFASDQQVWWTVTAHNVVGDTDMNDGDPVSFYTTDNIAPYVVRVRPGNNAPTDSNVQVYFNEPVTLLIGGGVTIDDIFDIREAGAPDPYPGTWVPATPGPDPTYAVTFTPAEDFEYDTAYTVTVESDYVQDKVLWYLNDNGDHTPGPDYTYTFETWKELTGLAKGEGCVPCSGGAGAAWVVIVLAALAARRRRA